MQKHASPVANVTAAGYTGVQSRLRSEQVVNDLRPSRTSSNWTAGKKNSVIVVLQSRSWLTALPVFLSDVKDQVCFLARLVFSCHVCRCASSKLNWMIDIYIFFPTSFLVKPPFSSFLFFQKLALWMISSPHLRLRYFPPSVRKLLCLCLLGFISVKAELCPWSVQQERFVGVFDIRFDGHDKNLFSFPVVFSSPIKHLIWSNLINYLTGTKGRVWPVICVQM